MTKVVLTPAMARYWPCVQCRAESGELCRTVTGHPAKSHMDRYRSVANWQRYGRWSDRLGAR